MSTISERFLLNWTEAFTSGTKIVGGKGWNLGRLVRYGFRIPAGSVLSTRAYEKFIIENRLIETIEAVSQTVTIDNLEDESSLKLLELIREKIIDCEMPAAIRQELLQTLLDLNILDKPLAVRSSASMEDSATMSFAGIHDSVLNVIGVNQIVSAIKQCYASLWTPRAVAYRRKMKVKDGDIFLGVVIQEMVKAKAAGIGFSCDPHTGQQDIIVINANFGLGESVVSGRVQPDEYYLDNHPSLTRPTIKKVRLGRKEGVTSEKAEGGTYFLPDPELAPEQALSNNTIESLGLIVLRVFHSLGQGMEHQDVEWVFNGQEIVLVQARPVTALPKRTYPELKNQPEIWSNGNVKDSSPMVMSELGWDIGQGFFDTLLNAFLYAVGYPILSGVTAMKRFNGRMYANLSLMQWNYYDCFGVKPSDTNASFGGHQSEININDKGPFYGRQGLKRIFRTIKLLLALNKAKKNVEQSFAAANKYTQVIREKDYSNLRNEQLAEVYSDIFRECERYLPTFSFMTVLPAYSNQKLVNKIKKYFPDKGNSLATAVLAGSAQITSAQHGYRLMELAQIVKHDPDAKIFFDSESFKPLEWERVLPDNSPFKQAFKDFLEMFGHRGVYEYEIMNPRWRQDPTYILDIIKNSIENVDLLKIQAQQTEKVNQAWSEISKKLHFYQLAAIKHLVKEAVKGAELREMSKSVFVKFFEPLRLLFEEIGQRLESKKILEQKFDVYHCTWSELIAILYGEWNGTGLKILVTERKANKEQLEKLNPPDVIIDDIPSFPEFIKPSSGKLLTGLGVSAGKALGVARLVTHPQEGIKLEPGDILVAPSTDPAWTPLFLKVSGIVMETGGFLSHGSIVAREYGIPSVVNIPGAMTIIKNGQTITVDGDQGQVIL